MLAYCVILFITIFLGTDLTIITSSLKPIIIAQKEKKELYKIIMSYLNCCTCLFDLCQKKCFPNNISQGHRSVYCGSVRFPNFTMQSRWFSKQRYKIFCNSLILCLTDFVVSIYFTIRWHIHGNVLELG